MRKGQLHQYIIATVVAFSLLSFVFLNFIASSTQFSVKSLDPSSTAIERVGEEEEGKEKAAPRLAVLGQLFDLVKKVVPGK